MRCFDSQQTQGTEFLKILSGKIRLDEFDLLRAEAGFSFPNNFSIDAIVGVLLSRQFPSENLYEYEWVIYECEFDRLRRYSAWMKMYLASLYIYCNKRRQWGITIESDYYYLVIETAIDQQPKEKELVPAFLSFVEWLYDWVEADTGYDDYYCLLAWTLLRRLSDSNEHKCFRKVVDFLLDKHYSIQELSELTVSDRGIEAWFELHQRIPCPEVLRADFERIIRGEPA